MPDQMIDAVNPANIPGLYDGCEATDISVLANPAAQVFDVEAGNATGVRVAPAMALRVRDGMWAVGYCSWSLFDVLTADMGAVGLAWTDAQEWPRPGVYLWAADPSGNIASGAWKLPVRPLAVQDVYAGGYDLSRVNGPFPARVAGYIDGAVSAWPTAAWTRFVRLTDRITPPPTPAPAPTPTPPPAPKPAETVNVQLPILQRGANGPSVRTVQKLVGVPADGIFGPQTHGAVVTFQVMNHLTADGVVGLHTWGALLGAPQ